jgi:1-deoxy-D-xylulose-5-phosphate reductoisomerase
MNTKTKNSDTPCKRQVAVLGSTGSIGTQALQVIEEHSDLYEVYALTAGNNAQLLIEQARKFMPDVVVIANESHYKTLVEALADLPIKVYAGADALADVVTADPIDIVLASMVGYAGLRPTMNAIRAGKAIALANKETLVVAGELVTQLAIEHRVPILPVDSEHSAIFQCLAGEMNNPIEKLLLTASGGPFRTWSIEQLQHATREQALKHPNWDMGAKITIDSASMMNKGFEVIEASYLFGVPQNNIEVVVHRESIIHSMVEYIDNSIIAQMSVPDMRHCIQHALTHPDREEGVIKPLSLTDVGRLTFAVPDEDTFVPLRLARECMQKGGAMPAILNAANEIAVAAFLKHRIGFLDIFRLVEEAVASLQSGADAHSLDDILKYDSQARDTVKSELIKMGI